MPANVILDRSPVSLLLEQDLALAAARGVSQAELSRRSGVPETRISYMLAGERVATDDIRNRRALRNLARALGYPPTRYLGDETAHPPLLVDLGAVIKAELKRRDWTQLDLHLHSDLPVGTISRLVGDKKYVPGPRTLARLKAALGIEVRA